MNAAQIASLAVQAVVVIALLALLGLFVAVYVGAARRYLPEIDAPRTDVGTAATDARTVWAEVERRAHIAARDDFAHGRRPRPNPHPWHSREFACWAIAYGDAWLALEHAAFPGALPDLS